jgi:hypothetical protein
MVDYGRKDIIEVSEARVARYLSSGHVAVRQLGGVRPSGAEESWRLEISISCEFLLCECKKKVEKGWKARMVIREAPKSLTRWTIRSLRAPIKAAW